MKQLQRDGLLNLDDTVVVTIAHLVTRREIPYDVPLVKGTTRDNVRALVDTLLTFSIAEPFRFVYTISAGDFERVLHTSSQDALRMLVRAKSSQDMLDLSATNHMRSQEQRQLAIIQRAEEAERHNLALQRQADAAELVDKQVAADAASEALRLVQLEERILRSPAAAQYDLERAKFGCRTHAGR